MNNAPSHASEPLFLSAHNSRAILTPEEKTCWGAHTLADTFTLSIVVTFVSGPRSMARFLLDMAPQVSY